MGANSEFLNKSVRVFDRRWKDDKQVVTKDLLTINGTVIGLVDRSHTMVLVRDDDRGPGWNAPFSKYTGVRTSGAWRRGENKCFGQIHNCHISQLEIIEEKDEDE